MEFRHLFIQQGSSPALSSRNCCLWPARSTWCCVPHDSLPFDIDCGRRLGWLSTAYLQKLLGSNSETAVTIQRVESAEIGTIGVGEATVRSPARFGRSE
ncbi:tryptophan 7-halogenase [Roseateles oligotrophus]|uniref:tryptophan 7-halogenase n=1 Tax=Roseateles oligotrophus TaxID=1769250 RepID=UPI0037C8A271